MKKNVFAAALAACMLCASVMPQALLRQFQTPQPTQVSAAEGSQLHPNPAKPEPARFLSVNSQHNCAVENLYLSFTNNGASPVTLTGEGSLEVENGWKQYYLVPRHDTAESAAAKSGISPEAAGRAVAPGETFLFQMYVGHYKPVSVSGGVLPFAEGSYRVSVEVLPENGAAYSWACLPFRIVAGEVQADQNNVSVNVARAAYSPRTTAIQYTIENHTGGDLWYDGSARLQRLVGESRWTDVSESRQAAGDLRQLPAGSSDVGTIAFTDGYALSPGTYRVVKSVAGLDLSSGQFTIPGNDRLTFSIIPTQVSVDWYAKADHDLVKRGWWTRTQTGRDVWLTAGDLYDGESAPLAMLRELEAFQPAEEPVGYSKDTLVEITLWSAGEKNITASLTANSTGTFCLVDGKWYKTGDIHVLDRVKTALDAVSNI